MQPIKVFMSWKDMHRACHVIAKQINRPIEVIVGLSRGGLAPAICLSNILGKDKGLPVYALGISSYTDGKQGKLNVYQPISKIDVIGKHVLLVDDLVDTGDTFTAALKHINDLSPEGIWGAVLYEKVGCPVFPNYRALTVRKDFWVVFPWENTESIESA